MMRPQKCLVLLLYLIYKRFLKKEERKTMGCGYFLLAS